MDCVNLGTNFNLSTMVGLWPLWHLAQVILFSKKFHPSLRSSIPPRSPIYRVCEFKLGFLSYKKKKKNSWAVWLIQRRWAWLKDRKVYNNAATTVIPQQKSHSFSLTISLSLKLWSAWKSPNCAFAQGNTNLEFLP